MTSRRGLAALAALAVATAPLWASRASADTSPAPSPSASALPVSVTLTRLTPIAPQPGDTLTLHGSVRNVGATSVTGLTLRLLVSRSKIGSRSEFDAFAADPAGAPPADAFAASTEQVQLPHTTLGAQLSERFTITVGVDDLQLPQAWQVYEMTIVVTGDTALGSATVGQLRTFLPWAPLGVPGVGKPTQLAWVWPLVDRPHRSDSSTWIDDDLAASLASDGRLGQLLAAGAAAEQQHAPPPPKPKRTKGKKHRAAPPPKLRPAVQPVPVTWLLDPQLVDDARTMAAGYTVRTANGQRSGTGKTAASRWLSQLKQALSGAPYFDVPYGDPDVTAAARAGLGHEVQVASTLGDSLVSADVGHPPLPYAWPPNGLADQRTVDTYFAAGETTLVLDSNALPIIGTPPNETSSAHAILRSRDGTLDALLADHTLTEAVDLGAHPDRDHALAIQRVLSELLMIQAERPFDQRSLVITPSRRWAPSASYAATLLSDTGRVPWIEPVSLPAVASTPVSDTLQRGPLLYTAADRALQLPHVYVQHVAHIKRLVDDFANIARPTGNSLALGLDAGVRRLLSSAWRADPIEAHNLRLQLEATVLHTMSQVHIASRGSSLVTLTSHTGTVPVTVANDLDIPVQVVVRIEPDQHLVVKSGRVTQTIPAHRQVPVDIRATAQTSGVFGLTVQLTTPDGRPYGAPVPIRVRSTAYGITALLITGGATAMLLITVVVRLVRRARSARRTAAAPA